MLLVREEPLAFTRDMGGILAFDELFEEFFAAATALGGIEDRLRIRLLVSFLGAGMRFSGCFL